MNNKKLLDQMTYRAPKFKPAEQPDAAVTATPFAGDTREPYQRDLGRIIHSASFRRLQAKTQVLGTGEGDFHRTRLTHTMEVGQIGRGLLWQLQKKATSDQIDFLPNSELIESICYAHDLGHPPFGHGGERALHKKMIAFGGFEGNAQTLRILTRLEKYIKGDGIKPTRRLLLGVLKYPAAMDSFKLDPAEKPPKCYYSEEKVLVADALSIFSADDVSAFTSKNDKGKTIYKTLDCSIMEIADDIAYGIHDLEDGIGRGIIQKDDVVENIKKGFKEAGVDTIREFTIEEICQKLFSSDSCERKHAISLLVGFFILSVEINTREEFEHPFLRLIAILPEHQSNLLEFIKKDITSRHIIKRREVQTLEYKGERIISEMFDAFLERPLSLVGEKNLFYLDDELKKIFLNDNNTLEDMSLNKIKNQEDQNKVARAISDYIAGMTNPYAEKYYRRLFEPGYGSSTDEL